MRGGRWARWPSSADRWRWHRDRVPVVRAGAVGGLHRLPVGVAREAVEVIAAVVVANRWGWLPLVAALVVPFAVLVALAHMERNDR